MLDKTLSAPNHLSRFAVAVPLCFPIVADPVAPHVNAGLSEDIPNMRSLVTGGKCAAVFATTAVIGALALGGAPAAAQQAALEGSWSGGGTVVFPSGERERARCRASFQHQGGSSYRMSAVCATPSTRVSQSAEIRRTGGNRFAGEFTNPEYGINGSIRITVDGRSLSASLSGGGGSAHFALSR